MDNPKTRQEFEANAFEVATKAVGMFRLLAEQIEKRIEAGEPSIECVEPALELYRSAVRKGLAKLNEWEFDEWWDEFGFDDEGGDA